MLLGLFKVPICQVMCTFMTSAVCELFCDHGLSSRLSHQLQIRNLKSFFSAEARGRTLFLTAFSRALWPKISYLEKSFNGYSNSSFVVSFLKKTLQGVPTGSILRNWRCAKCGIFFSDPIMLSSSNFLGALEEEFRQMFWVRVFEALRSSSNGKQWREAFIYARDRR